MTIEEYIKIEESKQIKCYCGHTSYCDCSPQNEAKQTAVEWLENQLKTSKYFYKVMEDINSRSTIVESNIFEQAKEMEKEQIGYSKEDMKLSFETGRNFQLTGEDNFNELIEQFKKK